MRPAAMTAIVFLLVSATGGSEGGGLSQPETAVSSQSSRTKRHHRHRHGNTHLRPVSRRRRPDSLVATALQLPADLLEAENRVELEHGRRRYAETAGDFTVCCPAVEERTSPQAGRLRDGNLAHLYASEDFQQVFFERSCENPGRQPHSRYQCVQEYSYSYAVLDDKGNKVLDLIRIRSGCRCEVKRRNSRRRRKKKRDRDRKKRAELRRRRRRQKEAKSHTNARNAS